MSKNGRRHDKRLLDKVDIIRHIPPEVTIWADTGFQGIDKQHTNTQIPKKGTRKRPLSPEQKQENKIISGIRIIAKRHYFDNSQLCFFATYQGIGCNHF